MATEGIVCGIVRYLPDGNAAQKVWLISADQAEGIEALLGEPEAQSMMTGAQMDRVDEAARDVPMVWGGECAR